MALNYPAWPAYPEAAIDAVTNVLRSGRTNQWGGEEVFRFERAFADYIGSPYAVAVSNGSVALELALLAIGLQPGDEVIVPARTFFATAGAVVIRGGVPVFADVDPNSQNICPESVRALISSKTRAVICVHHAGCPCDMDGLQALVSEHNLKLIEDCAQAHGALYEGRKVGTFGDVAAFSFCQDKIMSTGGEGGMVLCRDQAMQTRIWSYKDHGRNHEKMKNFTPIPSFPYFCDSIGSNLRMTEMQAAIGNVQLALLEDWIGRRREIAAALDECFGRYSFIRVPEYGEHLRHVFYEYYVFAQPDALPDGWSGARLRTHLQAAGVRCNAGSCPEVYLEEAFAGRLPRGGSAERPLPQARELGENSLKFVLSPAMDDSFVNALVDAIAQQLEAVA